MIIQAHVMVYGLVQGVFFRASTVKKAQELGLTGCVRNGKDGKSVEIIAQGSKEQLEKLILWAKKGPQGAKVECVEVKWEENKEEFADFIVT